MPQWIKMVSGLKTRIFLTRHGETDWNKEKRIAGLLDEAMMTEVGLKQTQALKERLKKENIDKVYSSPLRRARETANIVFEGREINIVEGLKERDFGIFDGKWKRDIQETLTKEEWEEYMRTRDLPKKYRAEPIRELQERGVRVLTKLAQENPGKTIAIVAHGTLLKFLLVRLKGLALERHSEVVQSNCCLNLVVYDPEGGFEIEFINDTKHIEGLVTEF